MEAHEIQSNSDLLTPPNVDNAIHFGPTANCFALIISSFLLSFIIVVIFIKLSNWMRLKSFRFKRLFLIILLLVLDALFLWGFLFINLYFGRGAMSYLIKEFYTPNISYSAFIICALSLFINISHTTILFFYMLKETNIILLINPDRRLKKIYNVISMLFTVVFSVLACILLIHIGMHLSLAKVMDASIPIITSCMALRLMSDIFLFAIFGIILKRDTNEFESDEKIV